MQIECNTVFSSVGTGETVSPVPTITDDVSLQVNVYGAQVLAVADGEIELATVSFLIRQTT